jgi:hypothetical protein
LRGGIPAEIFGGGQQPGHVVFELAEPFVAVPAQQAPDVPIHMAMVDD